MTQGPENPYEQNPPTGEQPPHGAPPPHGQPDPSAPPPPPPYGQPQQSQPYGQAPYSTYGPPVGAMPGAPYGIHPVTGVPYSDKSKVVAGLLQILVPFGIGRFYIGDTNIGIAQLLVTIFTCGLGALWPVIDGIIMLASDSRDANGLMLRS